MRAALLASAISVGLASVAMAFPVTLLVTSDTVRIHGCHRTFGQDVTGWHRHTEPVRSFVRL